jgi:hypothetical protein
MGRSTSIQKSPWPNGINCWVGISTPYNWGAPIRFLGLSRRSIYSYVQLGAEGFFLLLPKGKITFL